MLDKWRKRHLALAEAVDAWRIIPRMMVLGYAAMILLLLNWYIGLKPYVLEKCESSNITDCIVQLPTTQQSSFAGALIGLSTGIFGFYVNSGRKWSEKPQEWNDDNQNNDIDRS